MRKALLHPCQFDEDVDAHQRTMDTYDTSKKVLPSSDYHRGAQLLGKLPRMLLYTLAHHHQPNDHVLILVIVGSCRGRHRVPRVKDPIDLPPLLLLLLFLRP